MNRPNCGGADEWLTRFGDVYSHAAVIGANLDPISGDAAGETPYAAAIFLHRHSYSSGTTTKPTSGCVSLAYDDLVATLRLLDPASPPTSRSAPPTTSAPPRNGVSHGVSQAHSVTRESGDQMSRRRTECA